MPSSAQVKEYANGPGATTAIKSETAGIDFEVYALDKVEVDSSGNVTVINCCYKMKDSPLNKAGKNQDIPPEMRYEKHVFQDMGEATKFVSARMAGKSYQTPKPAKSKVSVKKA